MLWNLTYIKAGTQGERELLLKWLKDAVESQSSGKGIFQETAAKQFFISKMANQENDYSLLTLDGFKCFKSYFLLVNEFNSHLKRTQKWQ